MLIIYSETELHIQTQELEGKSVFSVHHVPDKYKISPKFTSCKVGFSIILYMRKQNQKVSLTCPESHRSSSESEPDMFGS